MEVDCRTSTFHLKRQWSSVEKWDSHMDLEQFTMLLQVQLPNCGFWRLFLPNWCLEACCDSVRWGLYRFVICWSVLINLNTSQMLPLRPARDLAMTWVCYDLLVLWPVLDAKSVLYNSNISNSVILDSSWFYPLKKPVPQSLTFQVFIQMFICNRAICTNA